MTPIRPSETPGADSFIFNLPDDLSRHVIFINCNSRLKKIVREIEAECQAKHEEIPRFVSVEQAGLSGEQRREWQPQNPDYWIVSASHLFSANDSLWTALKFSEARAVVILSDPTRGIYADAHSIVTAMDIEERHPQVHTILELLNSANRTHLKSTRVDTVVCAGELTENLIAQNCFSPGIARVFDALMAAGSDGNSWRLFTARFCDKGRLDGEPCFIVGKTYRDLAVAVIQGKKEQPSPLILCGFIREHVPTEADLKKSWIRILPGYNVIKDVVLNPGVATMDYRSRGFREGYSKDTVLKAGDRLVFIAPDRQRAVDFLARIEFS